MFERRTVSIPKEMSEHNNWKDRIAPEWKNFLETILSPWVAILLLLTILFAYFTAAEPDSGNAGVFTVILWFISGLVGALIWDRWSKITEQTVLMARGKSAIRSLNLLLSNIGATRVRIAQYLSRMKETGNGSMHSSVVGIWLEEELGRLILLQEATITAVENWSDILPEANIRPELERLNEEIEKLLSAKKERDEIRDRVSNETIDNRVQKEQLDKKLEEAEGRVSVAEEKLPEHDHSQSKSQRHHHGVRLLRTEPVVGIAGSA